MGRAIDDGKTLVDHERRLKLIEDVLEEMIQTKVHHIDLTEDTRDSKMANHELSVRESKVEGIEVKPDKKYTAPVGKLKKTTKKAKEVATT